MKRIFNVASAIQAGFESLKTRRGANDRPARKTSVSSSGAMFETLEGRQMFSVATSAIAAEYAATARETDAYGTSVQKLLGSATSAVVSDPSVAGAQMQTFHYGGAIYWSPATGAHVVLGAIGQEYAHTAQETDAYGVNVQTLLGLPTSDEINMAFIPGARTNTFQGGVIDWSQATGAHAVIGGIESCYQHAGGALNSNLGLPTTDEGGFSTLRIQSFQNGTIEWTPSNGAWINYNWGYGPIVIY